MSWIGPTIGGVVGIIGTLVAWRLKKKPQELDNLSKAMENWSTVWARLDALDNQVKEARGEADAARAETRTERAERELLARKLFAAMRHIEHQNLQLSHLGITPDPLPEELRS